MTDFFAELKRRQIYRVGAAYVVAAWVLTQVIEILAQVFTLPLWIAQTAIVLLVIGFPIALLVAWTIESKTHEAVAAAVRSKPTIVDWTLCGALAVVLLFMGFQQIAPSTAPRDDLKDAKDQSLNPGSAISLAVLPFTNLSGDASQEFFSDGVTEEITAALAKIPDLRVVARTSAFQFKQPNRDISAIAAALRATHLIEGSVRKAGTRLRITAQLINADNGVSIWTESYDRELTDVFAIQEDIARAIAGSLRMPLGLRPGEALVRATPNLGSYQEYLQAKAWFRDRNSPATIGPFLQTLESVVARDPGFGPAWAALSYAYIFQNTNSSEVDNGSIEAARRVAESNRAKAEMAAQKAIQLDPRHPGGYSAMGNLRMRQAEWVAAEDAFKQALELDPNDSEFLSAYALLLYRVGRVGESARIQEQARALEPLVLGYRTSTALALHASGRNKDAIAILEAIPVEVSFFFREMYLARAYAAEGRFADASDALVRLANQRRPIAERSGSERQLLGMKSIEDAASILRSAPTRVADPKTLPGFAVTPGEYVFVYTYVGASERVMDYFERELQIRYVTDFAKTAWTPSGAEVRKSARFKTFVRDAGLVDYWRARGWPDLCKPVGTDDFACA